MVKISFITQGCSANYADTEIMAGLLQAEGYEIVEAVDDADLVVLNSCTVKGPTENAFWKKLDSLGDKKVIVAGCLPQADPDNAGLFGYSLIGTYNIDKIVDVVGGTLKGKREVVLDRDNKNRLNLPKKRKNNLIEIVPVSHGCLGSCSFCKTKFARGNLYSYSVGDIVRHVSSAVKDGVKEIWLTSQDMGAYGKDIGSDLISLVKAVAGVQGNFKIRIGMANPDFIKEMLPGLIEMYKSDKVFKFLHCPVQAGSDRILKLMNRNYVGDDYCNIIKKLKTAVPDLTVSTDIICGFPGETESEFEDTLNLVKETKPDVMNISRFWPRSGTPAAKMEQVDGHEIKRRTRAITELFHLISAVNNKGWLGWSGSVLIDEVGKGGTFIGRNHAYKQVVVKGDISIGDKVIVKIVDTTVFDLRGEIVF